MMAAGASLAPQQAVGGVIRDVTSCVGSWWSWSKKRSGLEELVVDTIGGYELSVGTVAQEVTAGVQGWTPGD